ncbi:MAG: hypothetical protein A3C81_03085 [Candidatus Yanofskybacteria bacterium RIFCSPHIGHO2_02_FULL_46_19]|uniref:HTH cro/C1-type domain-containing protein n=2 Tax=Candidatus Yanofskyibacteriota TaxID=1752733 RepID=A0A1F8H4I9_9BACT|nr:MAG: hypothetical protein A3C81_03085 [Candidatus Yanofskybacteria bacterium RIFCSPHIGHO2_02_FULL_46_19]OGN27083.1 MAG: hypothetical protein A3B17_02130 [Candidatus Yanofskybacteria bacterium RIFCSPLOWO2_01_FULL_45_72]OGN32504.1 MAG: hypothetical protein A3J01_02710 [Candidatus Yanofskybacteria bacterium RIFCSPLOWO2_02_FULL_45_18]
MIGPTKVRKLRKEVGLSQESFARALEVSSREVARWETGLNEPAEPAYTELLKFRAMVNNLKKVEYDPARWFQMKSRALSGRSPKEVIVMGSTGLEIVFNLCGRMVHGITT